MHTFVTFQPNRAAHFSKISCSSSLERRRARSLPNQLTSSAVRDRLKLLFNTSGDFHVHHSPLGQWHSLAKAALSLLLSVCLSLGHPFPVGAFVVASATEDSLILLSRKIEQGLDSLFTSIVAEGPDDSAADGKEWSGKALIAEIGEVVQQNFADVRNGGFDRVKWEQLVRHVQSRPLRTRDSTYSAVRGLLLQLKDPYTRFLTPLEFSGMLKYDVSGMGLNLGTGEDLVQKSELTLPDGRAQEESGIFVVGLVRGLAGDQAGLHQGDEIFELEGQSLHGKSPFQVASMLQQTDSNAVILRVKRYGSGDIESLRVVRPERIVPSPVKFFLEQGTDVGTIKLTSFNARAQRDVAAAIQSLTEHGASQFVLDLRGNRGGLVSEGIEVARLFLENGNTIVRTEGDNKKAPRAPAIALDNPLTASPLKVLVDGHTASASEIVAGALRDNCRAVLVGDKTYGKGLIQSVYELTDGSGLVLTVGKYVTPNGTDIDLAGIRPDFRSPPSDSAADEILQACKISKV